MSGSLVCNYIDAEILIYESLNNALVKLLFGMEASKELTEAKLSTEGKFEELQVKIVDSKGKIVQEFSKGKVFKEELIMESGMSLKGYCEVFQNIKSKKYLNIKNFELELNFDFIPFINFISLDSLKTSKINITAKIFSKQPVISIFTDNILVSGLNHSQDRRTVNITFQDYRYTNSSNCYRIQFQTSEEVNPFNQITVASVSTMPISIKEPENVKFLAPLPVVRSPTTQPNQNKENILLNNLKLLLNLTLKKDKHTPQKTSFKKSFKSKILKIPGNYGTSLSLREEDQFLNTVSNK